MKPTWWLLYIIGLSLVGLLGLVEISGPRGGLQSVLEIIVVIGAGCRSWDTNGRLIGMLTEGDLIARRIRGAPDAGGRSCSEDATTPTS